MNCNWRRALIPLSLGLALMMTAACGGAGGAGTMPAASTSNNSMSWSDEAPAASGGGESGILTDQEVIPDSLVFQDPNTKLIRRAELYIQTSEFSTACDRLNGLVSRFGGYFQSAQLEGGAYRDANATRRGYYQIRVPGEQYTAFLGETGSLGYLTSKSEDTENISVQYADTQARLTTLRTKHERLLNLLSKAEDMEGIISLETALSDTEYEIERLTSALREYDSLISYSTITITLQEVVAVSALPEETASLGARMSAGFSSSVQGLIHGAQSLLIWVSYHMFGLLVFLAVAAACTVFGIKAWKKNQPVLPKAAQTPKEPE